MTVTSHLRTLFAGIAGGITLYATIFLTFGVVGGVGPEPDGLIFQAPMQSEKLVAVYTEMEPLPRIFTQPGLMIGILMGFATVHSLTYRSVESAWPEGFTSKTLRLAALVFGVGFAFFEFWTPFGLFGEPIVIVSFELVLWTIIAGAEAVVLVSILESDRLDEVLA